MFISGMTVENYRTFQNVSFHFDSQVNYIVGDNNIGKSNFLSLLKSATHGYGFKEADFLDPDLPIRVTFDLTTKDELPKNFFIFVLRAKRRAGWA